MEKVYLSTVIPVYQGGPYLESLVKELLTVKASLDYEEGPLQLIEAIFVDDSSIDDSSEILSGLQAKHPWVRILPLSRNFGQHPASVAGILHSSGDWVATLDEDLQHHPQFLIPLLMYAIANRQDVVYANPKDPVHNSLFRDLSSRLYKVLISKLSNNPHVPYFNSFRMMRGSVARAAASVSSPTTYFDIALCWFTSRFGQLKLPLRDQRSGCRSGYNLGALIQHSWRMLVSSEIKVLKVAAISGFAAVVVSLGAALYTLIQKLFYPEAIRLIGWTSLIIMTFFFGGLLCFLLGIVLEFMSVLVLQAQGKPTFFVVDRTKDKLLSPLVEKYRQSWSC